MSRQEKILDDVARLAGGAMGLFGDTKQQIKTIVKNRVDELAQNMELVPREDFERLQLLLEQTNHELELLKKRVIELELKQSGS